MADDTLLEHVRDYLVAQGVVRSPRTAGSLHPLFLEPRDGAYAPGEPENATEVDQDLVVSAYIAPGVPPRVYEGFFRTDGVDFWIRARLAPLAVKFEETLRATLHGQQNVMMGGERIIQAAMFTDMRPLGRGPSGYTFVSGYLFQRYSPQLNT